MAVIFKIMWQIIKAIFDFLSGVNKVVEKSLPSEKIQEAKFEQAKKRLVINEELKVVKRIAQYLTLHPRIDVDVVVDLFADDLHEEDIKEIRLLLHKQFPHRKPKT